jgi:tetratricopeptide (TPR) repeat protein
MIFASATGLLAQSVSSDAANGWLQISSSARNVGMGEVLGAVPDPFDEVDINPAGIGLIGNSNFLFSQNFWAQGISMQHLVYSQRLEHNDGFSLGVDYVNFGTSSLYTVLSPSTTATGNYAPLGLNLFGGYGMVLAEGLRAGLTCHLIYDNVQPTAPGETAALDAGLYYQLPSTPLSLSAVLNTFGWNLDGSSLPLVFKTSWAYRVDFDKTPGKNAFELANCLTLSAESDWSFIDSSESSFGVGGEYWYQDWMAFRAGYRFADNTSITGLTGFSLGVGARYLNWEMDYALTTIGDFGTCNQISLSLMMGEAEKGATPTPITTSNQTEDQASETVSPEPTLTPTPIVTIAPTPTAIASSLDIPNQAVEKISTPAAMSLTPVISGTATIGIQSPSEQNVDSLMWKTYETGITAYRDYKYEMALVNLKKAVNVQGGKAWQYAESYAMLGVLYEFHSKAKGFLETARRYYKLALWLDPKNKTAAKHLNAQKESVSQ